MNQKSLDKMKTEPKKLEWEKRLDTVEFGFDVDGKALKKFIQSLIQSTKEETVREIMKDLDKMKWRKTRKTMLLSYENGSFGFHTGKGEHNGFTVGTLEEYGNSHYNQAIDEIKEQINSLLKK